MSWDTTLPGPLVDLHAVDFDFDDFDFEPYDAFWSAEETADWLHAWTGNDSLTGAELRVFGQDGAGGLAALWLVRPGAPLEDQPVVFFESEGEVGVVASSLARYAWLLAGGVGPMEAVEIGVEDGKRHEGFAAVAAQRFPQAEARPTAIVAEARAAHPDFERWVEALCR